MNRFLIKLGCFASLQVPLLGLLLWSYTPVEESHYIASTIDKHRRLDDLASPRVIVVGGSNVALGIHAERLEELLGVSAVNMALDAGLGVDFMLGEVAAKIRVGDIVLLSLEYDLASGTFSRERLRQALAFRPASLRGVRAVHFREFLWDRGLGVLGDVVRIRVDDLFGWRSGAISGSTYTRQELNAWGDYVAHKDKAGWVSLEASDPASSSVVPLSVSKRILSRLTRFAAHCRAIGAQCVFTCPPRPITTTEPELREMENVWNIYRQIPGLQMLDRPEDHLYTAGQFYDTPYHLSYEAGRLRTGRIAEGLKPLIQARKLTRP